MPMTTIQAIPETKNQHAAADRIRVAVVIAQMTGGGAEKQVALLAEHIDRTRFDLQVVTFLPGGIWAEHLERLGHPVRVIARRGHYDLRRQMGLIQFFRKFHPHVVLAEMTDAHLYATPAALAVGVHGIAVGYRTVDFGWGRVRRNLEKWLVPYVDVQLANAEAVAASVFRVLRNDPKRQWVVYNALDLAAVGVTDRAAAREALGLPQQGFLVGFIASFSPEKDHETALRAMALASKDCSRLGLVLAGEGPLLQHTKDRAAELGIRDRCHFLGYRRDVVSHLNAFDLTLNSSSREGCCNSIIESLAAGIPVFATAVGGNVELIGKDERGRLFAPRSYEDLAGLLRSACGGQMDLAALGAAGVVFADRKFRIAERIGEMERLFRSLARLPRRKPFERRGPATLQTDPE